MNKTFSKSFLLPPVELTLDYIVLSYCLLNNTCFIYAEDNFNRVTSSSDTKVTASNITEQLNQYVDKICQHPLKRRLCEIGLYCRFAVKKCQKAPAGQGAQRLDNRAVG